MREYLENGNQLSFPTLVSGYWYQRCAIETAPAFFWGTLPVSASDRAYFRSVPGILVEEIEQEIRVADVHVTSLTDRELAFVKQYRPSASAPAYPIEYQLKRSGQLWVGEWRASRGASGDAFLAVHETPWAQVIHEALGVAGDQLPLSALLDDRRRG